MTTHDAQNKAIVRRFYEAFEADDVTAMKEVLAPDLIAYTHGESQPADLEAMLKRISTWNAAFETHFSVTEQIAEGDKVATRVTMHSIHTRSGFQGVPPTGKKAVSDSVSIERVVNGKIVERWVFSDWYGTLQQLGVVPAAQRAR